MASNSREAHEQRLRSSLRADVGPVDDDSECECEKCDKSAVYRVPWPQFGGDVAYCGYHLARYRRQHPSIWRRVRLLDGDVDDPSVFVDVGNRFVDLQGVPDVLGLGGERLRIVGLTTDGFALYESEEPNENDAVRYVTADRSLDAVQDVFVDRSEAGSFLEWFHAGVGVMEWDDDAQAAFFGGGEANVN